MALSSDPTGRMQVEAGVDMQACNTALRKLRQENHVLDANPGYTMRPLSGESGGERRGEREGKEWIKHWILCVVYLYWAGTENP